MMLVGAKPLHRHIVSAGIYALLPPVVQKVRDDEPQDIPHLKKKERDLGRSVLVFPVGGY